MQRALSEASFELAKPLLPTLPECGQPAGEGTRRPSASRRVRGDFAGGRGSDVLLGTVRTTVLEAWRCGRNGMTAVHSRWWGWTGGQPGKRYPGAQGRAREGRGHTGGREERGLLLPQLRYVRQRQFPYLESGVQISKGVSSDLKGSSAN